MNKKIKMLLEEKEKNEEAISRKQARNAEIDRQVEQLENTDIIGIVREHQLNPDQLADLLRSLKTDPVFGIRKDDENAE